MGMTLTVLPHETPCLRCISRYRSGPTLLTCDTSGVISPAPVITASLQCVEAMKVITGAENINRDLITIDVWSGMFSRLKVKADKDCPACQGKYEFLDAKFGTKTTSLCGQNSVQVVSTKTTEVDFTELSQKLSRIGEVSFNDFMLSFTVDGRNMVIFPDGRAIIKNTSDESLGRSLYAKYIGA